MTYSTQKLKEHLQMRPWQKASYLANSYNAPVSTLVVLDVHKEMELIPNFRKFYSNYGNC